MRIGRTGALSAAPPRAAFGRDQRRAARGGGGRTRRAACHFQENRNVDVHGHVAVTLALARIVGGDGGVLPVHLRQILSQPARQRPPRRRCHRRLVIAGGQHQGPQGVVAALVGRQAGNLTDDVTLPSWTSACETKPTSRRPCASRLTTFKFAQHEQKASLRGRRVPSASPPSRVVPLGVGLQRQGLQVSTGAGSTHVRHITAPLTHRSTC